MGQAGSRGGYLRKGGAGTPLKTMEVNANLIIPPVRDKNSS